jgi:hypothetical protein
MKLFKLWNINYIPLENLQQIAIAIYQKKIPRYLFLTLCFNLIVAPAVQATVQVELNRTQAYAIALLGLTTVIFSIYLFVVMFQPERF